MNIRKLTEKDIDDSFTLELIPPKKLYFRYTKEEMLESLTKDVVFGLFDDDKLIGKAGFIDRQTEGFEIDGLVVLPEYRGKGFGKTLLERVLHELEIKKIKLAFVTPHPENNAALTLYLKHGFIIKEWLADKFGVGSHRLKLIKYFS